MMKFWLMYWFAGTIRLPIPMYAVLAYDKVSVIFDDYIFQASERSP
jgi:hypothetical protein